MDLANRIRDTLFSGGDQAFEVDGNWIGWGSVRAIADGVDAALTGIGIPEFMPVGLIGKNRFGHASAFLGILASRRCVVPINPFQSSERIVADIAAIGVAAVVGDAHDLSVEVLRALTARGVGAICLETDEAPARILLPAACIETVSSTADVALLIPTSGTTGAPKRIPIRFDTLAAANRDAEASALGFGDKSVHPSLRSALVQYSPLVHITGALTVSRAGSDGRRVVLLEKFDAERWVAAVERNRIEVAGLPPTMMQMVLSANPPAARLASLRSVWSGSAPVDQAVVAEFERTYGVTVLGNYGATEFCGVVACGSLDDRREFGAAKAASVGRLKRDVADFRICDPESGQPLGDGESGVLELRVHRVGPDWMRTSDLARIDEDDFLYILGRADDAIIRGGFKIVPSVIADVVKRFPGVVSVAVVGLPDQRLGQVPAVAVEMREGHSTDQVQAIKRFLRENLVAYQVPARIVVLHQLPRTPSLKVDKRAVLELFKTADAA